MSERMETKLVITADREDYAVGLTGYLYLDGFSGFGEGWHNNSDVSEFCSQLLSLSESMEGTAELLGTQCKADGSDYLETFCIRAYPINGSKLSGTAMVLIPAAFAAFTPDAESSKATQCSGLTFSFCNVER